jgi:anaerobic magnesium-protoporphyrin IX monomethyl ester cyclase
LRIPFECITRADRMNAQMAETLAGLGCFRVWIGSESGSQRILDAMQRGVRAAQVRDAVRLLREHGIETGMFLMWGYEGEDLEDIEATVEHVKTSRPDVFLTTVSYPIKGTPYFKEVESRLVRIGEWATSTDRDVRIAGRHSRRFYQFADQLLKSESAGLSVEADAARRGLRESFDEVEA